MNKKQKQEIISIIKPSLIKVETSEVEEGLKEVFLDQYDAVETLAKDYYDYGINIQPLVDRKFIFETEQLVLMIDTFMPVLNEVSIKLKDFLANRNSKIAIN